MQVIGAETDAYRLEYTPIDVVFFSFALPSSHLSGLNTCASSPHRSLFLSDMSPSSEEMITTLCGTSYRLYAAIDRTIRVPFGTGSSWMTSPDRVVIGWDNGRTSSWLAYRCAWYTTQQNLRTSCKSSVIIAHICTTSRTLITAVVYVIASKSAIVKWTSPRACTAASVFLISSRRRDWISGCLASSSSAKLTVFEVVSCPAKSIVLWNYSNPWSISCAMKWDPPHLCKQFFFRQLRLRICIHIGFYCALIRFARSEWVRATTTHQAS